MSASDSIGDDPDLPAPAPAKGKALPVLLGLNTLLLAGVLVFVLKRPATAVPASAVLAAAAPAAGDAKSGDAADPAPGPTLKLDNFIIQLKAVESDRYVRVAFDMELGAESDRAFVTARMSPIRDAVIAFFSDRTLEELRGSAGLEHTKEELLRRLESVAPGHRIKALYITDFVVQ
jgi:flagellar FliL protein